MYICIYVSGWRRTSRFRRTLDVYIYIYIYNCMYMCIYIYTHDLYIYIYMYKDIYTYILVVIIIIHIMIVINIVIISIIISSSIAIITIIIMIIIVSSSSSSSILRSSRQVLECAMYDICPTLDMIAVSGGGEHSSGEKHLSAISLNNIKSVAGEELLLLLLLLLLNARFQHTVRSMLTRCAALLEYIMLH